MDDYSSLVDLVMSGYNMALYEENCMNVTEEEFVFDSNMNSKLKDAAEQCKKLTNSDQ